MQNLFQGVDRLDLAPGVCLINHIEQVFSSRVLVIKEKILVPFSLHIKIFFLHFPSKVSPFL